MILDTSLESRSVAIALALNLRAGRTTARETADTAMRVLQEMPGWLELFGDPVANPAPGQFPFELSSGNDSLVTSIREFSALAFLAHRSR